MTTILLVTGSRSLADNDPARWWVTEQLHPSLAGATLVVAGDARGVDARAHEMALYRRIQSMRWCVDGRVQYRDHLGAWHTDARWDDATTTTDPRKRPLSRNAAMVQWCVDQIRAGATVRVLGLVDPQSRTRGTDHTLGLCRVAGLVVERRVWVPT